MRLCAEDLVATYDAHPVLRGATLTLPPQRRTALLGANGSGKTTLLRCLSGAHRPASGRVTLEGVELRHTRPALHQHRRAVQLVLQDPDDQLFSADVVGDVSFGPLNLGLSETQARVRVDETLALLGISELAHRPTHQLSYGERKRVALAGAVAMRPAVLLLDEPTAGLDPAGVAEALEVMERLVAAGTTLLVATHDVDWALAWADEVAVVADGLVTQGEPARLLNDGALLTRARLRRPWPLELAARLGLRGRPHDLDAVVSLLSAPSERTTA